MGPERGLLGSVRNTGTNMEEEERGGDKERGGQDNFRGVRRGKT